MATLVHPIPIPPLDGPDGPGWRAWERDYPGWFTFDFGEPIGLLYLIRYESTALKEYISPESEAFFIALQAAPYWPQEVIDAWTLDPQHLADPKTGAWDPPDWIEHMLVPSTPQDPPTPDVVTTPKDLSDPATWRNAGKDRDADIWGGIAGFVYGFSTAGFAHAGVAALGLEVGGGALAADIGFNLLMGQAAAPAGEGFADAVFWGSLSQTAIQVSLAIEEAVRPVVAPLQDAAAAASAAYEAAAEGLDAIVDPANYSIQLQPWVYDAYDWAANFLSTPPAYVGPIYLP